MVGMARFVAMYLMQPTPYFYESPARTSDAATTSCSRIDSFNDFQIGSATAGYDSKTSRRRATITSGNQMDGGRAVKRRRFWIMVAGVVPGANLVGFLLLVPPTFFVLPQLLPPQFFLVATIVIFLVLAIGFQYTARLELGEHGLSMSWLGLFEKFVAYSEVSSVSKEFRWRQPNNRVIVACRRRPTIYIPVWSTRAASTLEAWLSEAVNVSRRPRPEPVAVEQPPELLALERGGRSTREWVAHLRRLGDGVTSRLASPPREALWAVAQHPAAAPRVRIAAAIALTGVSATEADRVRIADLARKLPDSQIRQAMELALHDDPTLSEVLADFVDTNQERSRD